MDRLLSWALIVTGTIVSLADRSVNRLPSMAGVQMLLGRDQVHRVSRSIVVNWVSGLFTPQTEPESIGRLVFGCGTTSNMPRRSEPASLTTSQDRLAAALAEMDRVFGSRTGSIGRVAGCTHCFDPEHLQIIGGPVDAIPDGLFSRALGKWGTTMDADPILWRRFTPRILRSLTGGTLHIAEGLIAGKFNEASWRNWPDDERASLEGVCAA